MIDRLVAGGLALFACAGCVTRNTYEAEVARSRGYEHLLGECRKLTAAMSTTSEKLQLERRAMVEERLGLMGELDDMRTGNEGIRTELERERALRQRSEAEIAELSSTYNGLVEDLEQELESGEIEIENLKGRLQVRALDQILFDSGSVEIKSHGREVLAKVGAQIAKATDDYAVRVEGHTDDVPIQTDRFPSNWELSAARATAVVRHLVASGVEAAVIGATGFGEFQPIDDNANAEGRSRNRRIEIVLVPNPKE